MANKNEVLKLGLDTLHGCVAGDYSAKDAGAGFVQGLIELNGGSTKINPKTFHRGTDLFDLVEEILPYVIEEGLKGDEFFMNLCDYRNLREGDMNEFVSEDHSLFMVGNIGHGTQAVRRQRLGGREKVSIPTQVKAIKVYEELRRLMAQRADFNEYIDRVGKSFTANMRNSIYDVFKAISASTTGLSAEYVKTGSWDANTLADLIDHVEASTGKTATVFGTKKALRKVQDAVQSAEGKSDMYNMGYFGKFLGTNLVSVKQVHKMGTNDFLLDDTKLYIIASDDKPIKVVNEGEGLLINGDAMQNADLTQEYLYAQAYGVGAIFNEKMGIYTISG